MATNKALERAYTENTLRKAGHNPLGIHGVKVKVMTLKIKVKVIHNKQRYSPDHDAYPVRIWRMYSLNRSGVIMLTK